MKPLKPTKAQSEAIQQVIGDKASLEKIFNSKKFNDLYKKIEQSNARFRDLQESQKRLALAIILSGKSDIIPSLHRLVFIRPVPSIEDFLSPDFIPTVSQFYDADKGNPWRKDLIKVFSPDSAVLEWILTGGIGVAKTSNSLLAHFYNTYRINSLRYPQLTLGSDPGKSLNLQLLTITLEKAKSMIEKMEVFLKNCDSYTEIGKEDDLKDFVVREGDIVTQIPYYVRKRPASIIFPNNIKIVTGSQSIHALGDDLYGGSLDEAEFRGSAEKGAEQAMATYSGILERIRSRFIMQRYTLMTLVSSIMHDTGIISDHLKNAVQENDQRTHISQYAIWEVRNPKVFQQQGSFYVLRGNKRTPSKVLSDDETKAYKAGTFVKPSGCKIIRVPDMYRKDFVRNVEEALRDIAGEHSIQDEKPFDVMDHCEDDNLADVFILTAPLDDHTSLIDQLPGSLLSVYPNGKRLSRYPDIMRYAHFDLADTGEAGVALVHKEFSRELNKEIIVVDFAAKIVSPSRISFEKIEEFGLALHEQLGINFHTMSCDQYQSASFLQKMEMRGVATVVKKESVDKTAIPYNVLSNVVAEGSLRCGRMGELAIQLENIYFHKKKPYSRMRKDIADALCGAVYHAKENTADIPVNYYEMQNIDISEFLPTFWEEV